MQVQEHAPLVGNRRGQGSFLCHRSSKGCTCQGDSKAKKVDRRTMKRNERIQVRKMIAAELAYVEVWG